MKVTKLTAIRVLLVGVCLLAAPRAFASDCVCVKLPSFPVGGGYWLHYAIKTTGDCIEVYPVPRIQLFTPIPEQCVSSTNCGTCTSLRTPADVAEVIKSNLYFPSLKKYSELVDASEFRKFLVESLNSDEVEDIAQAKKFYDECEFESPVGNRPPLVKLVRRNGASDENFYAVLWKIRRASEEGAVEERYLGVEVDLDVSGATILMPRQISRAIVQTTDGDLVQEIVVKGVLEVQIGAETNSESQVYFITLHNSDVNKPQAAFPIRRCTKEQTTSGVGCSCAKP